MLKVLVPLLLEALYKYNLLTTFVSVVKGFCNTCTAISHLGDKEKITSLSLRSLCKTVLGDTSLPTASALERSEVLVQIMASITGGEEGEVVADQIVKFCSTVASEEEELKSLKLVLGTQVSGKYQQSAVIFHSFHPQGTLRPIFESQLKQKRLVRNRAISLRRKVAEAGLDYGALEAAVKDRSLRTTLEATGTVGEDIEEIVKLIEDHFSLGEAGDSGGGQLNFLSFFPLRPLPCSEGWHRGV